MLAAARQRDRYAQDSAFAADARTAVQVSKDIQRLVREHSIEALAAMEWGDGPDHDEDDTPDAAPLPHRHRHPTRGLRVTSTMAEDAEDAALDADEADDDDKQQTAPAKTPPPPYQRIESHLDDGRGRRGRRPRRGRGGRR